MKVYFWILVFAVRNDKEQKKFNILSEGLGRRLQLDCTTCIYYTNDGLIIRRMRTYTNDSLIVCGIWTCIYHTNDGLIIRHTRTYTNCSLIICGIWTSIYYTNEGLIVRGISTYKNGSLIVCGIWTCIYYTNDGLIIRHMRTYTNCSLIVCGICKCIYLYYGYITGMNVGIINTNFSPCKLKRNCKQLSYTFCGWYMCHIIAVTDD